MCTLCFRNVNNLPSLPRGMESILDWKLGGPYYSGKTVIGKRLLQLAESAPDGVVM